MILSGRQTGELQSSSAVSFAGSKSSDYIRGLQRDLDRLLDEEFGLPSPSSRSQSGRVGKEAIPARECFLFTRQILPSNKAKQQLQTSPPPPPPRDPPSKPPPSSARTRFYRPNSSHQYLSATDVSDCSLIESTHGRPTRTTLLRAHQRVSSAPPVNAYEERRIQKQNEEERAMKRPMSSTGSVADSMHQEMVAKKVDLEGDTLHQFLIGARYNSAHYVDKKAIEKYGVYMSRHHPGQLFTKTEGGKQATPRSRPSSPVEAWNASPSRPATASTATIALSSPPRPSTPTGPAESIVEVEEGGRGGPGPPLSVRGNRITANSGNTAPTPTPRESVCGSSRRIPTPSFVPALPPRRAKSAIERRSASPLPQVVGLSLQIGPAAGATTTTGEPPTIVSIPTARQQPARPEAVIRARRVLVSSRIGGRFMPPTPRRQGIPLAEVNRSFSVRPWRDPRALRDIIRQSAVAAVQKAGAVRATRSCGVGPDPDSSQVSNAPEEQAAAEEVEEEEVKENPIAIHVEVRSTESGRSSVGPAVLLEDLENGAKPGDIPGVVPEP